MTHLLKTSIINFTAALMIGSLLSGCNAPDPSVGNATPAKQIPESKGVPVIDASDASLPIISINLPTEAEQKRNGECLLLATRDPDSNELHPVHGIYDRAEEHLTFTPSFPLLPNLNYEAVNLLTDRSTSYRWDLPTGDVPTLSISPTLDVLPANHLKFYLSFSEPMQQENPWEYCKLLNITTGEFVGRPFRHTELWNKSGNRLTLWFHPGRQKTGVNLNLEIGPILEPEHEYQLLIDKRWKSLAGTAIGKDTMINFQAGQSDHSQPDPESWDLVLPTAETTDPLTIQFNESLDHALLNNRALKLLIGNTPLSSHQEVWENGQGIYITPLKPWNSETYIIQINPRLEDLAGNSIERPFEVDLNDRNKNLSKAQEITFTIKSED